MIVTNASVAKNIPFFNYPEVFRAEESELTAVLVECARRGAFIMQRDVAEFEQKLAERIGVRYALGVANATDGLIMACRAAGIREGDEVIISSHTMIATAVGVHWAGGTPVPVDCGPDHLIDPHSVERAVTPRTRAILPTQLNGRTCDMDAIREIADRHDLMILEDAAQGLGSKFRGKHAGSFGVAAAISFYPAKVLGCLGDGGAVVTSDERTYERLWQLRDYGRNREGEFVSWGGNSRLDNLQAAVLNFRLARYDSVIQRRREMAGLYEERLRGVRELTLPPGPTADPDHFDIYQNYEIEAARRDDLKNFLASNGIGSLIQWGGVAVHQCRKLGFTQDLPKTDELFRRMLMLPFNMALTNNDIDSVCDTILEFYAR